MGYYAISIDAIDVTTAAFYQLDPAGPLTISQGGFTCGPTQTMRTTVAIYPQLVQLNFPAADFINGSILIVTDSPDIAGNFLVSPAINSNVTLTLTGNGGEQLGTATLEAGQTSVQFDWKVGAGKALSPEDGRSVIEEAMKTE